MDLRIVAKHVGIFKSCEVAPLNVVYENYSTFPYKIQTTQIRYLIFIGRRSIIHKLCLLRTDENVCNTWAQYILFDRFRISKQCKSVGLDAHEMHPCKLQMHMHFTLSNKDSNASTFIKLLFIIYLSFLSKYGCKGLTSSLLNDIALRCYQKCNDPQKNDRL